MLNSELCAGQLPQQQEGGGVVKDETHPDVKRDKAMFAIIYILNKLTLTIKEQILLVLCSTSEWKSLARSDPKDNLIESDSISSIRCICRFKCLSAILFYKFLKNI